MSRIETSLKKEVNMLEGLVSDAERRMKSAPDGKMCVSAKTKRKGYEYYLIGEEGTNRYKKTYISVDKKDMIAGLAQKEYDQKLIAYATKRMNDIRKFLRAYENTSLNNLYEKTNDGRKKIINSIYISDDEYVRRWQKLPYTKKEVLEDGREIYTEKGERVRSKSEKIIADKLHLLGIPYRYESQLKLNGNITMHPDFTILKMPQRKEVYLEHLGMLDDRNYLESTLWKLNVYEMNGIYLGDRLFFTHETGKNPLNSKALDGMLHTWFLEE